MLLTSEEIEIEEKKWERKLISNCKTCNGLGYVVKTTEDGMYNLSSPCKCKLIAARNIKLLDWGMPRKFLDDSKWNMELLSDKPFYKSVLNYINNFEEKYENGSGMFLTGPHGRGKSTIECVIGKHVSRILNPETFKSKQNYTVAFSIYDDIVKLQFDKTKSEQLKTFLYKSNLLILDNVGNEIGKNDRQFSQRLLEMILRKRDNDCLPTIISSNYSLNEIEQEYNKDVRDFIEGNSEIVYVSGDNHRNKQNIKNDDELIF